MASDSTLDPDLLHEEAPPLPPPDLAAPDELQWQPDAASQLARPATGRRRTAWLAGAAVLVVIGVTVTLYLVFSPSPRALAPGAAANTQTQMQTQIPPPLPRVGLTLALPADIPSEEPPPAGQARRGGKIRPQHRHHKAPDSR